ncbi:MAG: hypothetical protein LBS75_05140 [Synergistaceae bacterium]|jgi:hypothetical protein|nr:hypothetical protein [Synergistaceae bacterium]
MLRMVREIRRECRARSLKIFPALAMFAVGLFLSLTQTAGAAQSSTPPPYRRSGVIPGTSLTYEKLFIGDKGDVSIVICNPESRGVNFSARFTFYSAKGEYLTGFAVEGVSLGNSRTGYDLSLPDHKKMRRAAYMKVLGRSGISFE